MAARLTALRRWRLGHAGSLCHSHLHSEEAAFQCSGNYPELGHSWRPESFPLSRDLGFTQGSDSKQLGTLRVGRACEPAGHGEV